MSTKRKGGTSLRIRMTPALRHQIHTLAEQRTAQADLPRITDYLTAALS